MSTKPANSKPVVRTEVVLEIEGEGLLSGGIDDFILPPGRGSEYFYKGNLYEVVHAIQTVGDATSTKGSMLVDLLGVLYPDLENATNLLGGMKYIKKSESETLPGQIITDACLGLVLAAQNERLLFLRLRLVHAPTQKKSLVDRHQAALKAARPAD
jgi:hypothetical protein